MNKECWKCEDRLYSGNKGKIGLCDSCWSKAENIFIILGLLGAWSAGIALFPLLGISSSGEVSPTLYFFFRISIGAVAGIFVVIAGVIVFWVFRGVFWLISEIASWLFALLHLPVRWWKTYQESLRIEAVKRAELANAQRLNGAELDALLTEEYMERQGWK